MTDATITGQAKPLDEEEVLLPLLLRQVRQSAQIKEDIMHYDRAELGSSTKSYRFLYNCLSRRIELNRQNSNRSVIIASRGNGNPNRPGAPGPKAKAGSKTSSRGRSRNRDGGCGDAPASGTGDTRTANPAPENACFTFWRTGTCPRGK